MATVSAKDLFFRDLLAELKIKPWWEKWRGYGFAVTFAVVLAINCFLPTGFNLSCWPKDIETEAKFETYRKHADVYCLAHMTNWVRFGGALAFVHCLLVFVVSSWWLQIPKVGTALESYVKIRTDIEELDITAEHLRSLILRNNGENDGKLKKSSEACGSLRDYYEKIGEQNFRISRIYCFGFRHEDISLSDLYERRNIILLSILLVTCVAGLLISVTVFQEETYSCVIPYDEPAIGGEYKCTVSIPEMTNKLWSGFLAGIGFEIIFTYLGLRKTRVERRNKYGNEFLNFTEILWMGSRTSDFNFEEIFRFMFDAADKSLREKLLDQTKSNDTVVAIDVPLGLKKVIDISRSIHSVRASSAAGSDLPRNKSKQ